MIIDAIRNGIDQACPGSVPKSKRSEYRATVSILSGIQEITAQHRHHDLQPGMPGRGDSAERCGEAGSRRVDPSTRSTRGETHGRIRFFRCPSPSIMQLPSAAGLTFTAMSMLGFQLSSTQALPAWSTCHEPERACVRRFAGECIRRWIFYYRNELWRFSWSPPAVRLNRRDHYRMMIDKRYVVIPCLSVYFPAIRLGNSPFIRSDPIA